jgi:heme exporter protein B
MSTRLSLGRVARAVAAKDLRIELRSRVIINQVFPFAGLVMVMFAFALDNDDVLTRVAGGLVWLATLFSLIIIIQRSFAVDTADGALEAQRVAGLDPAGIFVGKALAVMVQLVTLAITCRWSSAVGHLRSERNGGIELRGYAVWRFDCRITRARNIAAFVDAAGCCTSTYWRNSRH